MAGRCFRLLDQLESLCVPAANHHKEAVVSQQNQPQLFLRLPEDVQRAVAPRSRELRR